MGLDMTLKKRTYIGAQYKHNGITGEINLKKNGEIIPINVNRVTYIEEDLVEWRNANHIHNWFVEKLQDGEDDCRDCEVSTDDLHLLLSACKEAISDKQNAQNHLPTKGGFFFGGTEYDEWYFKETERTISDIEKIIEELKDDKYSDLIYTSSW